MFNTILEQYNNLKQQGMSERKIALALGINRCTLRYKIKKALINTSNKEAALKRAPKVLLFDLETAPTLAYVWGRWQQNISTSQVSHEGGYILSAAWKWLGKPEVYSVFANDPIQGDDINVCESLYEAIEEADVIIAHNLNKFDLPMLNTRLIMNGFGPLKNVKKIDTLVIARKNFRFSSNRLDDLGLFLKLGRKQETSGFDLWKRVVEGDITAREEMTTYNKQDVILLEQVYNTLKAYDSNPNINMAHFYNDSKIRCPSCGSEDVTATGNSVFSPISEFPEMLCNCCGARSRTRKPINTKEKRQNLLQQ